ncbi:MAG: hypothetical protein A2832_00895 [Candidatus Zambryskibacteria bacterium RIFCSPHIGHO2_01_FULL_44_22b]|uniref:DUF4430 domain-containing protein n=1 Tax=Candidatus Zambryskibacteria bacterium RIFCSPHIGHO2_01_FULL_44_22b TaxID=1802737 RepID=A0A1G2T0Q4_9BACT|nr:MAG: hypothetical protein A2832_00895 [Candidatus Zambryskibacteria bacterium RIFCSPHIGHO2_01_FULL_44_22b]
MKNALIIIGIIIILFGGSIWWSKSMQKNDPDIISRSGLHWHPYLEIYVKGEKQVIPPNIGIGGEYTSHPMGMAPIHTHDDANQGIIHMEFESIVRKEDTKLSKFFDSWNKDINSFGSNVSMIVNGEPNAQLGDYEMKDGAKIELRYE